MMSLEEASGLRQRFNDYVKSVKEAPGYRQPIAFAIGIVRCAAYDRPLEVRFPMVNFEENFGAAAVFSEATGTVNGNRSVILDEGMIGLINRGFAPITALEESGHHNIDAYERVRNISRTPNDFQAVMVLLDDLDSPPQDIYDAYLRLYLLSTRKVKPNSMNLTGLPLILPNVVQTSEGPCFPDELDKLRWKMLEEGRTLTVRSLDKFPFLLDHISLPDVRIAAAHCVRLGAYLSPGVTVMPSGFVNFNAGVGENVMVEGRVSQGIWVGKNSDIGGGASLMGTLSGGGSIVVSVGENCLIGANAGVGFPLGDRCTIAAGLYVTASMPVYDARKNGSHKVVKAITLAGQDDMLFVRNSQAGRVEVWDNNNPNKPNTILHDNTNKP